MTNLRNFFNSVSGNNRIFTSEDIGSMSPEEFSNNEQAIRNQWGEIGIPSNGELSGSDDVVYVHAYTRGDGTEVRAHYRSKGGGRIGIGTVAGGASGMGNSIMDPNQGAVMDERNGYYDPRTGKKVYYPNVMHMTDSGINTTNDIPYEVFPDGTYKVDLDILDDGNLSNYDVSSALKGSAVYTKNIPTPMNKVQTTNNSIPFPIPAPTQINNVQASNEDNCSIYESLLKGTLPELRDWNFNREFQNEFNEGVKTKDLLDAYIPKTRIMFPNGVNFWDMASQGIDRNKDYIDKNGSLYNKVSDLPSEYQNWARNKVNSQYGINDCRGIIFNENSGVSQTIAHSKELNDYISRNFSDLMAGKVIKDDSISFDKCKDPDLWSGLGKADIIETKVKDGYFEVIIGDTYDFNKDSDNILVQMGRQVQDAGLLEPYYTITKVKVKL